MASAERAPRGEWYGVRFLDGLGPALALGKSRWLPAVQDLRLRVRRNDAEDLLFPWFFVTWSQVLTAGTTVNLRQKPRAGPSRRGCEHHTTPSRCSFRNLAITLAPAAIPGTGRISVKPRSRQIPFKLLECREKRIAFHMPTLSEPCIVLLASYEEKCFARNTPKRLTVCVL